MLDFRKLVGLPIAIPGTWLSQHPGAIPYVKIGPTGDGYSIWRRSPISPTDPFRATSDLGLHMIGVFPSPGSLAFPPGQVTVTASLAPAGCRDNISLCAPIDPAKAIRQTYTQP